MAGLLYIILLENPESQRILGSSSAVTQRGMSLAIINAADKEFGRDAWKTRECVSLPGFYTATPDGASIVRSMSQLIQAEDAEE